MLRNLPRLALVAVLSRLAVAQVPPPPAAPTASLPPRPAAPTDPALAAAFIAADVHPSTKKTQPFMNGGLIRGERYFVHDATMVDLISNAYGLEPDNVLGGPAWLERDRFDINAKVAAGALPEAAQPMLKALLRDRFKLVAHSDTRQLLAFVMAGKGNWKIKPSDTPDAPGACNYVPPPAGTPPSPTAPATFHCQNETMDDFAKFLRQAANGYITSPMVNVTELKGGYDFDFAWTGRGALAAAGADGISVFAAAEKIGLKIETGKAPLPVVVVASVMETPTPNAPGVEAMVPKPPVATEFEVAIIKPSKPDAQTMGQINPAQLNLSGFTLKQLITIAWDLNPVNTEVIAGAPKWLDQDKFDITAKMPQGAAAPGQQDIDQLRVLLQKLLIDRFQMKVHMEDRPRSAYRMVAAGPKLVKADPLERTSCKEGPGPDGKDPRTANPVLGRLMYCRNMTMAELGAQLPLLANGYIYETVLDATGLTGGYDFTLSFSPSQSLNLGAPPPPSGGAGSAAPTTSDPNGALSLSDAMQKQLGIRLVKEQRSLPTLVIDHVEEKPTDN